MGTLASNRKGYIQGPSASSYSDAFGATADGVAYDALSNNQNTAIQYFQSSGRGSVFRFNRTFIHFDTSGISGGSSFQLVVTSTAGNSSSGVHNVIAVNHNAGSGNGSELANADFNAGTSFAATPNSFIPFCPLSTLSISSLKTDFPFFILSL